MTPLEIDVKLKEVARIAEAQAIGPYGPQSDAVASLYLIRDLAVLIQEMNMQGSTEQGSTK